MILRDKRKGTIVTVIIMFQQRNMSGYNDEEMTEDMEEEEEEGECDSDEEDADDGDSDDEGDPCDPQGLFDALAAAREAEQRFQNHEKMKIDDSCRLSQDFLNVAFRTAVR